jgi:L-arabinose isomerase
MGLVLVIQRRSYLPTDGVAGMLRNPHSQEEITKWGDESHVLTGPASINGVGR